MMRRSIIILPLLVFVLALAAACGDDDDDDAAGTSPASGEATETADAITVVATTTQIADMARNVADDRAEVESILTANTDPHEYEPEPATIRLIGDADLVLRNGLELDAFLDDLLAEAGDAPVVTVTEGITQLSDDPHVWFDVARAKQMVENIRDALTQADPDGAEQYEANARDYLAQLDELDQYIRSETDTIPPECRKLVTDHEILTHFAAAYDLQIIGTIVPQGTTEAEPSAADLASLIDAIRVEGVPAVFGQASENRDLVEQVAGEAGISAVTDLYLDALGPADSGASTYIDMMRHNTDLIVEALEGCAG
ncbi:MAG TPA: metal ABC transporter substrate-binding protein [Dehalococcoidia bacterium]|nr:metal ABC transporter substrate-binding protein [Dehalococcoidia bacterium]